MSIVRDISLAPEGERKIQWAKRNMPILSNIDREFSETRPFEGLRIALSVHMEAKTAYLCRVLSNAGAEMHVTGCNPLSTQDDVAAAVAAGGIDVYAWHGATEEEYTSHLCNVLEFAPNIIIDDGGDLVNLMHTKYTDLIPQVIGGCEETTTGIRRLRSMAARGELRFPMIMVNDAKCKFMFDNRYGTGQSVWDGINRTTNLIVAGKTVVVAGFGMCSKGIAMRAKGQGANVVVTEVDPVCALEATMEGYRVMPMSQAAVIGDVFVTATGCCDVIRREHFEVMRDGAILCNAGHFNVEVRVDELAELADASYSVRNNIVGYRLSDGRELFVLAEGRLVNIAAGDGHPAEIMDMSFAIQAMSAAYLVKNRETIGSGVIAVPDEIDNEVAMRKLESLGLCIDVLSDEQAVYLAR